LKQGGNAVDAAVTAEWVLSVVEPQSSGLGGGGLFLFYDVGTRRILSFDGSVKAPAKISAKIFYDKNGNLLPYQPEQNTGGSPVGVPGLLKLTEEVHAKYGTHKFPFAKLFEPAIREAEKGIRVSASLAKELTENKDRIALSNPALKTFFIQGLPLEEGKDLFQPELAKTFRLIQDKGTNAFYKGAIAKSMERAVRKDPYHPGSLSERDLESYRIEEREPVHVSYQGYDLFSVGPPSDGGVMLFRALNILSNFGMSGFGQTPETYHLLGETQKTAFPNRSGVADPDLFNVPLQELLSEEWAKERAGRIKFDRVLKPGETSGKTPQSGKKRASSSVIVVDPQGNIAILSATLGDPFGSALKVPDGGFFLNDLLTDLAADLPPVENQGAKEGILGGQRPRGPEAPVFVFKEGKPAAFLNAYGSEDPAGVLLNVLVQKLDLKASCASAIASPRILAQGRVLRIESGLYDQEMIRLKLDLLGHKLEKESSIGFAQMVCFNQGSDKIAGESDPRSGGEAAGF